MQQTHNQPLYAAKDRVPFNLTLVLALGIAAWGAGAVFGIWDMGGNPNLIFLLGIAVAVYTWLFTPKEYLVYSDAFCVAYGRPRVKTIHFSNIAVVEMGSMATLDQLRIRPVKGRRQSIRVRDPEAFFDQLEAAINAYREAHPEENMDYQFMGRYPPEIVEGEPAYMAEAEAGTTASADAEASVGNADSSISEEEAPATEETPPVAEQEADGETVDVEDETSTLADAVADESIPADEAVPDDGRDDESPQEPTQRPFY